ncbi:SGNH/GDSL hydrolase family protein [Hymenobacter cellulosivorans]|uniref:IPT/TIG domain-containing protein n=1 Tax=Hymenobacter cellulosivorans TaxID=2932249 RepID=A0ABY4FAT5_9BACT|nr:IPT/TIG domain-containing protein [Hymenobacter cellulosivorans]UOQ53039.1 IPT/TIG domain-containing protein [Hymenobacter cellulosivorans]
MPQITRQHTFVRFNGGGNLNISGLSWLAGNVLRIWAPSNSTGASMQSFGVASNGGTLAQFVPGSGYWIHSSSSTPNYTIPATFEIIFGVATAPENTLPVANAGADTTLTLPSNSVVLQGSGSDAEGSVTYAWKQITGPNTATGVPSAVAQPVVSNLVAGVYQFRLTVTDTAGATKTDDVLVTVNAAPAPVLALNTATPTSGQQARRVVFQGSNFGATQNTSTLKIGAVNFDVLTWSNTAITAAVPVGAPSGAGTASLTIGGTTVTKPFTVLALTSAYTGDKNLLAFLSGDSQTAEYGLNAGEGYAGQMNATWDALDTSMSVSPTTGPAGTAISGATTTQIRNFFAQRVLSPMQQAVASGEYDGCLYGVLLGVNNLTFALVNGVTLDDALATAKTDIEYMVRQALALPECGGAVLITQTNTASVAEGSSTPILPYVQQLQQWAVALGPSLEAELGKPVRVAQSHLIPELTEPATDRFYFQDEVHPARRGQVLMAATVRPVLEQIAQQVYAVAPPVFEFTFTNPINATFPSPTEVIIDDESVYYGSGAVSNKAIGPANDGSLLRGGVEAVYNEADKGFQFGMNDLPVPRTRTGPSTSANIKFGFYPLDATETGFVQIWRGLSGGTKFPITNGQKMRIQMERAQASDPFDVVWYINEIEVFRQVAPTLGAAYYFDVSLPGGSVISAVRGAKLFADNYVDLPA